VLGMKLEGNVQKLSFTSPVDAFFSHASGEVAPMHLEAANALRPKFLRCPNGPSFGAIDYNDGPSDVAAGSLRSRTSCRMSLVASPRF
jgi:hypothetical protein